MSWPEPRRAAPRGRPRVEPRLLASLSAASFAAWTAGILQSGALWPSPASPRLVLVTASLGALLAGVVRGRRAISRALYVLPFALYCATLTFATDSYLRARGRIFTGELLVPSAVALVPFALVYRPVSRLALREETLER